jgi:Family of unknown function (DUF5572)
VNSTPFFSPCLPSCTYTLDSFAIALFFVCFLGESNWLKWASRKFAKEVDFDAYKAHRSANTQASSAEPTPAADADDNDGPSLSYAELVELIQSGKPVPGIKDIPDTVLTGEGSTSVAVKRRKPWEKDAEETTQAPSGTVPVDEPQVATT